MATTANKDYCATLGVKKAASPVEIGKAFRELASKFRPDVITGDAHPDLHHLESGRDR